tara:strand:- start:238 stop:501 length:264 start_codon:yes stop_codon:yes gene_type:complete
MRYLAFFLMFSLVSCSQEEVFDEIINTVEDSEEHINSIWFERQSGDGNWDKVVLVFGWDDDISNCEIIRQTYEQKYPMSNFRCNPVK